MTSKHCSAVLLVLAAAAFPIGCGDDNESSDAPVGAAGTSSSDAGMPGSSDGGATGGGSSDGGASTSDGGATVGNAGAASGGAPSTPADDCADYAAAWCGGLSECAPMRIIRDYEDEETCVTVISERCRLDGERGFPIADIAGCIETLSEGDCEEILSDVSGACQHERGAKAAGETCLDHGECESGICLYSGTICGECTEVSSVGDMCGVAGVSCTAPGLTCDYENEECVELEIRGLGELCGESVVVQCRSDLVCSGGECVERLGEAEDCSEDPNLCDMRRWLFCVDNECVQQDVKTLGESCGAEWPFPRCSDYAFCDPDALECVPRHGVDEDCADDDPVAGSTCLIGLSCVDGKCVDASAGCLD